MFKVIIYGDKLPQYLQEILKFDMIDTRLGKALIVYNSEDHIVYFGFENEFGKPYQACKNYFSKCQFVFHKFNYNCFQNSTIKLYGTPFQQRVWQALCEIKPSFPVSYSHLATLLGNPTAIRAVAHAVAKNPVSGLIPCHRIIYKSGKNGHYAWGTTFKTKLLDLEMNGQNWLSHAT